MISNVDDIKGFRKFSTTFEMCLYLGIILSVLTGIGLICVEDRLKVVKIGSKTFPNEKTTNFLMILLLFLT